MSKDVDRTGRTHVETAQCGGDLFVFGEGEVGAAFCRRAEPDSFEDVENLGHRPAILWGRSGPMACEQEQCFLDQ